MLIHSDHVISSHWSNSFILKHREKGNRFNLLPQGAQSFHFLQAFVHPGRIIIISISSIIIIIIIPTQYNQIFLGSSDWNALPRKPFWGPHGREQGSAELLWPPAGVICSSGQGNISNFSSFFQAWVINGREKKHKVMDGTTVQPAPASWPLGRAASNSAQDNSPGAGGDCMNNAGHQETSLHVYMYINIISYHIYYIIYIYRLYCTK